MIPAAPRLRDIVARVDGTTVATVPYGYGRRASPRTFGHSGKLSSTAFADPEHGLAVALLFNGTPSEADHERRLGATLDAIYEDLGLISA